ncbi:MAG: pyruvate, phosphate dikinase [Deltaproteobacteria bacterium]|nr:pyruvate, phosphate dikinase [Deltaproteobacteria bacterium]
MTAKNKQVYFFGGKKADGNAAMRNLLGGKGANLAEMVNIGIPVPPGFTISTKICNTYLNLGNRLPDGLTAQVDAALLRMARVSQKRFGDKKNPLLVSVRSGAAISMPGMMDTILNLGINDDVAQTLIKRTGNDRFVYDAYRRFIMMYCEIALGMSREPFEKLIVDVKKRLDVCYDFEVPAKELKTIVQKSKRLLTKAGFEFPEDPMDQLWGAIAAVFRSWQNPRAITYRELNGIPDGLGTAVNVQAMVFGNTGPASGTGVAFTRNPASGEKRFYGEWLQNAQGEDVVAGIRTPHPLEGRSKRSHALNRIMPDCYRKLHTIQQKLEKHYRDMQDLEFTIEDGRLWLLQTRNGKRTGPAAVRMAADMVKEKLITPEEALLRVSPTQIDQLLRPVFEPHAEKLAPKLGRGLPAGPGAATGRLAFSAATAVEMASQGPVILARTETSPEDIAGMAAAEGILTTTGGMTSHAALVARQMGKVCVAGCAAAHMDYRKQQLQIGNATFKEGDYISLDGSTGMVMGGEVSTTPSEVIRVLLHHRKTKHLSPVYHAYEMMMTFADQYRRLGVRTNADQPEQAQVAIAFGAEGIGLCRTEHMFFGEGKIDAMREMILAENTEAREVALRKLLPLQRKDFQGLFKAMNGRPVTIRTLDPPLHEFLPTSKKDIHALAKQLQLPPKKVEARIQSLHEFNPMLGHRGCRLGITYPEVTAMQARAIFEAAVKVAKSGIAVFPQIMIPLVGKKEELALQVKLIHDIAEAVFKEKGKRLKYLVGTMIEIPRAAVTAHEVAEHADFFSFGTNDLTQMTLGVSRDDAASFLTEYQQLGIYDRNPFEALDQSGVGQLVEMACEKGRAQKRSLELGVCGEHGGEPSSIEFFHRVGLDYVSCSPYRVPVARLAAAQAAIRHPGKRLHKVA